MATSLTQLHKQIAKLEKQAQAIKRKDARGVIARIKEAIATYDLTAEGRPQWYIDAIAAGATPEQLAA